MTTTEGKSMHKNGSGPTGDAQRDQIVDALRELALDHEARVRFHTTEAARARSAINILAGLDEPKPKAKPAAKAKGASWRDKDNWQVSEQKVAEILQVVNGLTEPTSATAISDLAHSSHATVRKALEELRLRERVRVAGHRASGRHGNAPLWMPMPENVPVPLRTSSVQEPLDAA